MLRIFKIFALLIPFTVASLALASPTKKINPLATPKNLMMLEDALAGPDLVGLVYLDMDYFLRLEKAFMGEEDPLALPTSTGRDSKANTSFLNFLGDSGINVSESVDYIIGGFFARDKNKGGQVQIALGNFPVETLTQYWKTSKDVKQTEIDGRTAWLWSPVDTDTCKPSRPEILIAEKDRLITGDPETVSWFLKRMDQPKAQQDLSYWRNYRKGKLFSFAVFLPKNLKDIPENGFIRMMAQSMQERMVPVKGLYGGATVTWDPTGVDLELLLESTDAAWNWEQHQEIQKWKKKTLKGIEKEFKSVKNLLSYIDSKATDDKLILQAKINEALVKDISGVFQEGVHWFASALSSSMSISNDGNTSGEKTIPYKEVNQYKNIPRPKDLDPFDATANPDKSFATTTGPFGIQVKGISLNSKEAGVVDLDLEVVSSSIPKLEINSFAEEGEGTGAWFRVTHVFSKNGKELLREELCGKDRNSKAVALQKGFWNVDVKRVKKTPAIRKLIKDKPRWSNLTLDVLKGDKTVHLKPGTRLSDIATIEGEVSIQLPSNIAKNRIKAPFKNKVVQTGELRIKMKSAASDTVSFTASGKVNHLLETRALNKSGKYLQSSSSMSSRLFFGKGSNKNKQFRGQPKTVEFVVARETSKKTYPFQFKFQRPAYPASPFFKSVSVETQSRRAFLSQRVSTPKRKVCSNGSLEFQSRPFYICLNQSIHMQSKWKKPGKYATGSFLVHSADTAAITNNLSAAQLTVEKVIVKDGSNPTVKTLSVKDAQFLNLSSNYVSPLKGDQLRIEAGPVKEENESLTPVGFKGYLKIRLPRKLSSFRLDLFTLGSSAQSSNGLKAKFTGVSEKGIRMEIEGPRETLVHFIPLNLRGKSLTQKDPRIEKMESEGKTIWQAEVQAPPETRYMDIVFAPQQDTWEIPFHLEK
jgi:hypothetical protein